MINSPLIAKFVCWVNITMRLFSLSLELIYSILSLTYWYLVSGTSLTKKSNQPDESRPNVHFNTNLVKTVFHQLSVIKVSFLMETDFLHRFQPYRFSIWKKEGRKVFQGLNAITEQYLFKLRKEKGINVPRGCYHAVMTTEEMVDFDYWRQVRKGKSRQRFFHYRWDRAFEVWTKETTEELIDVASILERVDSDGWVLLNITEQYHYEMWRDWKWRQLEEKDLL